MNVRARAPERAGDETANTKCYPATIARTNQLLPFPIFLHYHPGRLCIIPEAERSHTRSDEIIMSNDIFFYFNHVHLFISIRHRCLFRCFCIFRLLLFLFLAWFDRSSSVVVSLAIRFRFTKMVWERAR